ncbi:MAG: amidohydrolase [Oscillospiraceae bacterium]|jgi:amidohydrolase|nr:amidohydrolase [Oscillospiraceae bacterium]
MKKIKKILILVLIAFCFFTNHTIHTFALKINVDEFINQQKIVEWRRHFHMFPELSFQEYETTKYIIEQLSNYPELDILRPTKTGLIAVIKGEKPGKVVALRADIDALPIQEETDVEFKSKNPGIMHACGHDCHAAMLLGAIDVLYRIKNELSGTIKFIFQHAEEDGRSGGAEEFVKSGFLNDVEAFYGSHVFPEFSVGVVLAGSGPVWASSDAFNIEVIGKGGHAAYPEKAVNPIIIGAEIVRALNLIISNDVIANESAVVTVGSFHAGTMSNIIPNSCEIKGIVRAHQPRVREFIEQKIKLLLDDVDTSYGTKCKLTYSYGYSAVINDENLYHLLKKIATEYLPNIKIEEMNPTMYAEDFSAYRAIAPSFFACIGSKPDSDEYFELHHSRFNINEKVLAIGTALYVEFALSATIRSENIF